MLIVEMPVSSVAFAPVILQVGRNPFRMSNMRVFGPAVHRSNSVCMAQQPSAAPGGPKIGAAGATPGAGKGKATGGKAQKDLQGRNREGGARANQEAGGHISGKSSGKTAPRALKGVWRVFNVEVAASKDAGKDSVSVTREVVSAAAAKLGVQAGDIESGAVRVVRKSFDARRVRRTGLQEPHFNYVLDIELGAKGKVVKLKAESGKFERATGDELFALTDDAHPHPAFTSQRPVAVVGSGPAGTCLHIYTCIYIYATDKVPNS
jgi:hypothetical protein